MPNTNACRLCGRRFRTRRGRPLRYCARCGKTADKEVARSRRASCKECGRAFGTATLAARYCSDPCRKRANARASALRRRRAASASTSASPPSRPARRARKRLPRCRICGGPFPPDSGTGRPKLYCSPPCRAEGRRARMREYMRGYLADPKRRAVHAARLRAMSSRGSRRGGGAGADGGPRARPVQCGECGAEFATTEGNARYCSDPCRTRGRARARAAYKQRHRERGRTGAAAAAAATTAKCRVCAQEFAPGRGGHGLVVYCSRSCQDKGNREYRREYDRQRPPRQRRQRRRRARNPGGP